MARSPASLRNFSFTSAVQFLQVLMATLRFSPVCRPTGNASLSLEVTFILVKRESHLAFVNSTVDFSKKSFTKNLTHNDVISGDFVLFYRKKWSHLMSQNYNISSILIGLNWVCLLFQFFSQMLKY